MPQSKVTYNTFVEKIDKLIATQNNPRKIDREAYEKLKKSLKEFPEMRQLREIVVDEDLKILGGHQRIYALKDLGEKEITVKQVIGLSEKQKREFIIKDNTSSGSWDADILANDWDLGQLQDWGVKDFNFGDIDEPPAPAPSDGGSSKVIECPNCGAEIDT